MLILEEGFIYSVMVRIRLMESKVNFFIDGVGLLFEGLDCFD